MTPKSGNTVTIMMAVVALSWVLGFIELATSWIGIPCTWLLWIMGLSVLAHGGEAFWFTRRQGLPLKCAMPHVLAILVFGMTYIWRYDLRHDLHHPNGLKGNVKTS